MIASTALTSARSGVRRPARTVGQRILGGMAERFEAREIEEAAIALHRVDEAEDAVEPRAVVGLGFPGDDLAAQRFQHFPAFGHEIGNQIVHCVRRPRALSRSALCRQGLMPR